MAKTLETVLLLALPASGKSEVRKYLELLDPTLTADDFHMGPSVQLDDYPYVHLMREVDHGMRALGGEPVFFHADNRPFKDARDWGTLIELVNEDYFDLVNKTEIKVDSAGDWLLDRFDATRKKVGATPTTDFLDAETRTKLSANIEDEARKLLNDKVAGYPDTLEGKTLVIEFARGGKDGSEMPLDAPFGYDYSMGLLADEILEKSTVLYIWVSPEESRRKNAARSRPNASGSILHHGVPIEVLMNDYGCDDMAHLIEKSDKDNTLALNTRGKDWKIPVARFDNRVDKTSFIRDDKDDWAKDNVDALHNGLKGALETLAQIRFG